MTITLREALLCAMSKATDDRGLRLQTPELPAAIAVARAIETHLSAFGYKILPIAHEAPPFNERSAVPSEAPTTLLALEAWFNRSFDVQPAPSQTGSYTWCAPDREAHHGDGTPRRYVVIGHRAQTTRELLDDQNTNLVAHLEAELVAGVWARLEPLRAEAWNQANKGARVEHILPTAVVRRTFTVDHGDSREMNPKLSLSLRVDFPDLPETWGNEVQA